VGWTCSCGYEAGDYDKACKKCRSTKPGAPADPHKPLTDAVAAAVIGAFVGMVLGFLLRPSVPLVGQLPLQVVITAGSGLTGLDTILKGTAETSFNYLLVGALIGGFLGYFLYRRWPKPASAGATTMERVSSTAPDPTAGQNENTFCHACGRLLPPRADFCTGCGSKRL
jgi:hypothetical protein